MIRRVFALMLILPALMLTGCMETGKGTSAGIDVGTGGNTGGSTGGSTGGTTGGTTGGGGTSGGVNQTASLQLQWTAPTTRVNGEPMTLSDIGGYRIYYGESEQVTDQVVTIEEPTTRAVLQLRPGTYFIRISTYDTAGIEGPRSAAVMKSI